MSERRDIAGAEADPGAEAPGMEPAVRDAPTAEAQAAVARAECAAGDAVRAIEAGVADDAASEAAPPRDASSSAAEVLPAVAASSPPAAVPVDDGVAVPDAAAAAPVAPAPAVPPTPAPPSPGARLREQREARGIALQQVTDSLHIEPRLVAAMENDDYSVFDAPVYARGFLRKYAAFLDLSPDEIVAGYDAARRVPEAPSLIPTATAGEPPRDWSAFRMPAVVALALAIVGGAYWWWSTHAPAPAAPSSEASVGAAAPVEMTAASSPEDASGAVPVPAPAGGAGLASAVGAGTPTTVVAPASAGALAPGAASAPAPMPAAAAAPPSRVAGRGALVFRFTAECWIEVTGPGGERRLFDLARAGETRAVSGPGPWRVFVGYADGVSASIDGRTVPVPVARRRGATARFTVGADGSAQ